MKKFHVVLTTIYDPVCLEGYFDNILKFGWLDSVKVWVVADKKTPLSCNQRCVELNKRGLDITFVDLELQENWLKPFPEFAASLPFNNDTRRNIGYLMAYQDGCEVLISIDDDNFPTENDFIGGHSIVGSSVSEVISDPSGYYNICEHIEFDPPRDIYPRGFPFELRDKKNHAEVLKPECATIGVNAGLWLQSPDIDATTWLNGSVSGVRYKGPDSFVLDNSTWSPVNTQNTAITRELIPYYFCVPMGHSVPGGIIHRYGDIWGGYFCLAVMQYTQLNVSFGLPIADHNRNPHNYLTDLRQEFWGMLITDLLLENIKNMASSSRNLDERAQILVETLKGAFLNQLPTWCAGEVADFVTKSADAYQLYTAVARKLVR